jgi:DNA-binding LytR/AlgR family response regulator
MSYLSRTKQTLLPDSILWFEGDGNYTRIHRQEQPALVMAYTLKRFEEHFTGFVRVRRDVLVNPRYIQSICWNGQPKLTIYLSDGTVLTASRRRHRLLAVQRS